MRAVAIRRFVVLAAVLLSPANAGAQDAALLGQWPVYRDRFVAGDGRVLDTGNHAISHTEGQGFAMLFAEACDDRQSFERIWHWTRDHLQRHDSALFSWKWDPAQAANPIVDPNDASDGDILIGWALTRAAARWHDPEYHGEARRILSDIRHKSVVRAARWRVLLPGIDGFVAEDGSVAVNPSYYVFPAFKDFQRIEPSAEWARLRRDGLALLAKARFGTWQLTPDWVTIDPRGEVTPFADRAPRFGFDAIRIPLYLIWSREATPLRLAPELNFWSQFAERPVPAWVDVNDATTARFAGSTGIQAIVQLARLWRGDTRSPLPAIGDKDDYYSATLILAATLAHRDIVR
jgi:endo-1,4-beta-D-glucanase Y